MTTPTVTSIADRLARRLRSNSAGAPLITYYDLDAGERTELSAVTYANWVAKTANLLTELAVAEGDVVQLDLARRHPGHWVTLVWAAACWQVGATVAASPAADRAAATVVGPEGPGAGSGPAVDVVACSLHPLGLGFAEPLPAGVIDYALEVRGQPDTYAGAVPSGAGTAWEQDDRQVAVADLVQVGAGEAPARRLVQPRDGWSAVVDGLLTPLNSHGSAVIVVGTDRDRIDHVAETERITRSL